MNKFVLAVISSALLHQPRALCLSYSSSLNTKSIIANRNVWLLKY